MKQIAVQRMWLNAIMIGIVLLAVFWAGVVLRSEPSPPASASRRMNSIMERWVQTCRYELLGRT